VMHVVVDSGRWLIEHNRAQIRREFAPQRPLPGPVPMPVPVGGPVEAAQPKTAKPAMPAAALSAAPVSGARTMTREEAIALGRAQAQDQTLTPHKPAAMASEARP